MTISSERWGPLDAKAAEAGGEEAALAARVSSVRALWSARPRAPSPPAPTRKMRSRRRQPRRITHLPPPLAYCLEAPVPLVCDPSCKFQFDAPLRPPQLSECQRAIGRLSASVQAVMRASAARCPPYRGTNVSRYAPTSQRPDRRYIWWPRDRPSPRLENKFRLANLQPKVTTKVKPQPVESKDAEVQERAEAKAEEGQSEREADPAESPKSSPKETVADGQVPSTSAAMDAGLSKKRLYSTVLSMSAPAPVNLSQVGCVRLSQTPGVLKLNPKIVLPSARIRPPNVDNKFEELEKEALEQYKASDESIDTKFRELEKEAVEQYSNSNSNTSCSSGKSAEKRAPASPAAPDVEPCAKKSPPAKFPKENTVDSVVIYSQNFETPAKAQATSGTNLKNFHTPPRGEKKEQVHRPCKSARCFKGDSQRAASDTDNDARESSCKGHKGSRWALHVGPAKKRHLTLCVSDFSSDEELDDASAIKDAGPRMKNHAVGRVKMSAHGGGDLQPILRKT